jgi:heat shock protein HslJ
MRERVLTGCGRILVTGDLIGIYWRLVELEGQPVPATPKISWFSIRRWPMPPREPHMLVTDNGATMTVSTGCTDFSGPLEVAGERAKLGPFEPVFVICKDSAASQGNRFRLALESADRLVVEGDTLTLYAEKRVVSRFEAVFQ